MPTYDYKCGACGHRFELFQSMSAKPERKCPQCKKNALERLIGTGAAVLFKGSGFYQTDYRSESYKQAAKADAVPSGGGDSSSGSGSAAAAASGGGGGNGGGESKPAGGGEAKKPAAAESKSAAKPAPDKKPPKAKAS